VIMTTKSRKIKWVVHGARCTVYGARTWYKICSHDFSLEDRSFRSCISHDV